MSYPQFGYNSYSPAVASTLSSQLLIPGSSITSSLGSTTSTSPCDTTPPSPSVGSTQPTNMYSTSTGLLSYPRVGVAGLTDTVYTSAYATQGYVPFGTDPSAFYSPLNADNTDAWRSLSGTTAWPYDPNSMTGYPYSTSYGGLDVRRKNATRESTSTLKAWLYEHIKNPYPTKGEKIMLAIITKMTLTQVSTWFANARRRLKKENKMQWSPRNRSGDDDDHKSDDDNDDNDACAGGDSLTTGDALRGDNQHHPQQQHHHGNALNNNNSKSLAGDGTATTGNDVNAADGLAEVTTSNFGGFMHSDSSHKNLLGGGGGGQWGSKHALDNGDAFGSLQRDADDTLRLRREDDEDIIVDGGDSDPLSRLDFTTADLQHSRLKHDSDLHATHKLDSYDESPLSQLSTPLGSPSHGHGLSDNLLNPLGSVKAHNHCSNGNDVITSQHGGAGSGGGTNGSGDMTSGKVTQDMTLHGSEGSKPRIWSLADVATSITSPSGRRTPGLTVNSSVHTLGASSSLAQHASNVGVVAANKHASSLTAFSSPVTSQHNSSFQPWVNGTSVAYGGGVAGHGAAPLSYNYSVNPHASLGNAAANQMNVPTPQRADLSTHSLGGGIGGLTNNSPYGGKLPVNYGDKSSLAQFSSGFSSGPEVLQTAFKPVAKRL